MKVLGFVKKTTADGVWVILTQSLLGRVFITDITSNPDELKLFRGKVVII